MEHIVNWSIVMVENLHWAKVQAFFYAQLQVTTSVLPQIELG
jgi:hypothetical protein